MSESLFDILGFPQGDRNEDVHAYVSHLGSLTTASFTTEEAATLSQSSHSRLIALQSLSKKSHKQITESITEHESLRRPLSSLASNFTKLRLTIPKVESEVLQFSTAFSKSNRDVTVEKRKQSLLLLRNVEKLSDVLELPTLVSTAVANGPFNHASALDLSSHVGRLRIIYPSSNIVSSIAKQTGSVIDGLGSDLVLSLRAPGLKLAPAMRTAGVLRRLAPDVTPSYTKDSQEKALGVVFTLQRMAALALHLEALRPLRQLADGEAMPTGDGASRGRKTWSGGQHSDRYLKRHLEILREHMFAIVSMFKSVFTAQAAGGDDPLLPVPSGLSTLPPSLIAKLLEPFACHLPLVGDKGSRDSIFTQLLYCAGSLGRLSGDFSLLLFGTLLRNGGSGVSENEWVEVAKRHRMLTGRLDSVLGDQKLSR